ncbi:MAG: endonuclease V [Candidatus Nanohaloarchaea archaeon]
MRAEKPEFLADPSLSRDEMEEMQRRIAGEAVFEDEYGFDPGLEDVKVAGVDQAFLDERAVSAAVVMENGEVVERVHGVEELELPYIPGLLAFRETPSIVAALEKLETEPDLLFLDGSGRIHFRQAGIATHVGVLFDVPAVGIAKNLLCGEPVEDTDNLEEGDRVEVVADNSVDTEPGTLIGYAFQSRQNAQGINPLYISSGHRINASTAVDFVERTCDGYKLPEPTRRADSYVDQVKQELK